MRRRTQKQETIPPEGESEIGEGSKEGMAMIEDTGGQVVWLKPIVVFAEGV